MTIKENNMYPTSSYTEAGQKAAQILGPHSLSMTERLHNQREELRQRLALLDEAIAALDGSPEIARAVDAITRLGNL